ncbi:uncharacterized protein METZ01_LOCUS129368 [marine metagenome]|uniref:Uncharacterized protein n=1 Tax=marine metagenome TaxID=408172 RepID=A0A381YHM7_9ZZZZ
MRLRITQAWMILGLLVVAACTDVSGPASPSDRLLNRDVAMVAADAALEDLSDLVELMMAGALAASTETTDRSSTRTRTVSYYDADGNEQDSHDPLTTASIHVVIEGSFEASRGAGWTASGTRARDLMITGLEGENTTRTTNGNGAGTRTKSRHTDDDGVRTYDMTATSVIDNVVHEVRGRGVARDRDAYPLSGTITRDINVSVTGGGRADRTKHREVVITFNGTNLVTMTVNGEAFEVDLSTRKGRNPVQKRG